MKRQNNEQEVQKRYATVCKFFNYVTNIAWEADVRKALYTASTNEEKYDAVCKVFEYVTDLKWRLEKAEREIMKLPGKPLQPDPIETFNACGVKK